jgi:hypothetical protein
MTKRNKSPDVPSVNEVAREELALQLAKLLTPEELANAVAGAETLDPNRDSSMLNPNISNNGHQGEFREPEHRDITIKDEAKINITRFITKPEPGVRNIMPTTEIPGIVLMNLVMGIHIDEMLDPERRALHPEESPEQNQYEIYCIAMKGFKRKGLDELLRLGELEASERGLGDNLTPQVMQ